MKKTNQNGAVLIAIVIMMPFFLLIASAYLRLAVNGYRIARKDQLRTHAQLAVDAGIDVSMDAINQDDTWTGTGSEIDMPSSGDIRTTYQTVVNTIDPDVKVIVATGRSYHPASSTTPSSTLTINVSLRPVRSGDYSVVGGVGGLIMDNHAKILGGDVLVNGSVTMKNHAQIGLVISPVNLKVAHQTCPATGSLATYPRLCNNGENGQPISIIDDAHIYGSVRANNQTTSTRMTDPGLLTPHCLIPSASANCVIPEPLPPHDRAALITTITNADNANAPDAMTGAAASCSGNTSKSWPANLKINGDVTISNKCKLTVNGDVWITGKLDVQNSQTEMIVADSLGTTKPVIMVDGDTAKFGNSAKLESNSAGTGFHVITYKSDAICTTQVPGCASISGQDLFNSQGDLTIELDNSASGPNTIFYAKWSKIVVKNSGEIGALVGQTIDLSNSGTITFGTSAGTGTSFWVINSYRRSF